MRKIVFAACLIAALSLLAQTASVYRITHTYLLGGDGSWDYVVPDPPNHRVFVARQTGAMVIDEDTGKLLVESPVSMVRTAQRSRSPPGMASRLQALDQVSGHVRSQDL